MSYQTHITSDIPEPDRVPGNRRVPLTTGPSLGGRLGVRTPSGPSKDPLVWWYFPPRGDLLPPVPKVHPRPEKVVTRPTRGTEAYSG